MNSTRFWRVQIAVHALFVVNDVVRIAVWPIIGLPWPQAAAGVFGAAFSSTFIRRYLLPNLRTARADRITDLEKELGLA